MRFALYALFFSLICLHPALSKDTKSPFDFIFNKNLLDKDFCGNNIADISPDGKYTLVWKGLDIDNNNRRPPYSILIDNECAISTDNLRKCVLGGVGDGLRYSSPFTDLYWSNNSKSIFGIVRNKISMIDVAYKIPHSVFFHSSGEIFTSPNYYGVINVTGTLSDNIEAESKRIISIYNMHINSLLPSADDNNQLSQGMVAIDKYGLISSFKARLDDNNLLFFGKNDKPIFNTQYKDFYLGNIPEVKSYRDANGSVFIAGGGALFSTNFKSFSRVQGGNFFSKPIIDSANGLYVGNYSNSNINLNESVKNKQLIYSLEKIIKHKSANEMIEYLQINSNKKIIFAVSHDLNHGYIYRMVSYEFYSNKNISKITCPTSEFSKSNISTNIRNIGEINWPIYLKHYKTTDQKTLTLFFHGGPLQGAMNDEFIVKVKQLLQMKSEVMVVDISGSTGNTNSISRLSKHSGKAIELDAKYISRYIKKLRHKYAKINIYTESFGSVIIPSLLENGNHYNKIAMVVPLIKYEPPIIRGDLEETYSRFTEVNSLGTKNTVENRFSKWLDSKYSGFKFDENFLILQGDKDPKSKPESTITPKKTIRIIEKNAGHWAGSNALEKNEPVYNFLFEDYN